MNEKIKNLTKNPKLLVILGIFGMALIVISSIIPSGSEKKKSRQWKPLTRQMNTAQL